MPSGERRIYVFIRGRNNALWYTWFDGGTWQNWESLGGVLDTTPDVCSWGPGRIDIFVRGTDKALKHRWFDAGTWQNWESQGGVLESSPFLACGPGSIDVFVKGTDNALWHKLFEAGTWQSWKSRGEGGPVAVEVGRGKTHIFGGFKKDLQHKWFDGTWHDWESLGAPLGVEFSTFHHGMKAISWGEGRIDVLVIGNDNALWDISFDGTKWQEWKSLGEPPTHFASPHAVCSWGPGRIDVFARGGGGQTKWFLWHKWFDEGTWHDWESIGGLLTSPPAVCSWGTGRIDVFVKGTDNALWHRWFEDRKWNDWETLGAPLGGNTDDFEAATAISWEVIT